MWDEVGGCNRPLKVALTPLKSGVTKDLVKCWPGKPSRRGCRKLQVKLKLASRESSTAPQAKLQESFRRSQYLLQAKLKLALCIAMKSFKRSLPEKLQAKLIF